MSQEIKCLKSRRARKVVPAQDVDMNHLMSKFGMDQDSEESGDEDFNPTNVDSNSSEESHDESSSSDDNGAEDEVIDSVKQSPALPSSSSSSNVQSTPKGLPIQQAIGNPSQEELKPKQHLVQIQQLPAEVQQLIMQNLQSEKLPKQQSVQEQSLQQHLQQQLAKLQLLQQQLPKQQQSLPITPKQNSPIKQLAKQQSTQQQLPKQRLPQQDVKKQLLQLVQINQKQLAKARSSGQQQNTAVQFNQLPNKIQQMLIQQVQQSGQRLNHLQQSKFIILNQQTSSTNERQGAMSTSSSKQVNSKVTLTATTQPSQQKDSSKQASHDTQHPPQDDVRTNVNVLINRQNVIAHVGQLSSEKQLSKGLLKDKEDSVLEQQNKTETPAVVKLPIKKETTLVETVATSAVKEVNIMLCFVCLEESKAAGEDMAACDRCGMTVHEGCYGVPEKSDDEAEETRSDLSSEITTPWFCDSCRAGVDKPTCELCPSTDGVLKQTIHGSWVHMVCSLYIPGVEYVEPGVLSGISLDQVPANKWGARACQLCEDELYARTGVCISCDAGLCKSFFHVTCAQKQGLLCEEEENSEDDEEEVEVADPYYAYCKLHCDKDMAKSKRRNWLALMSRYKQFSYDNLDYRAKSVLLDQQSQYCELMEKMTKYYKPDEQCIKQERWLHHHPAAFQQLLKKAELLGHVNDTVIRTGSGRSKVTPSLTCDFINYYTERNGRIKNMQDLNDKLVLTNQLLDEDCNQLQEQVTAYELNHQSVHLESAELQEKIAELYKCIQVGCEKPLPMPSFLTADTEDSRIDDDRAKQCTVCCSSNDQHLVITCDTCDQHYHIGCLDPPLTKVPKKTAKYGWQCEMCCCNSGDDLIPTKAPDGAISSRSGRVINRPTAYKQFDESSYQHKAKRKK